MHDSLQIMFILSIMTGHLFWKATILGYPSWLATSIERPPSWVIHHDWQPLLKGHHLGLSIMTGHLYWKATILGYPSWLATSIERPTSWVIHHDWPPLLKGHHLGLSIMTGNLYWKATILDYPSWLATSIERPTSWVAFLERIHCISPGSVSKTVNWKVSQSYSSAVRALGM